jgi:IMP dehydrogenase/GMP reductase
VPRSVQYDEKENPDGITFEERMEIAKETFVSVSLKEAQKEVQEYLLEQSKYLAENPDCGLYPGDTYYFCIDIAHGTLSELYDVCKRIKDVWGKQVVIMTGNIANPSAYTFYADAGIDYMRVGVGGGSRCTSSANVSIHYPMATLLDLLNEERKSYAHSHNGNAPTKIIADGGIGWFDDIQKSFALGADAVMCGKIFAECEEASDPIYYGGKLGDTLYNDNKFKTEWDAEKYYDHTSYKVVKMRDYYGMSTKRAQKQTGGSGCKTSEGIDKPVEVKHPVAKWVDNMQSYLRSCMTYTNSHTIKELRENAQVIILGGSGDAAYRK